MLAPARGTLRHPALALLVAAAAACGPRGGVPQHPSGATDPASLAPGAGGGRTVMSRPPSSEWKQVDDLVEQQKMQEAADLAARLRLKARADGDEAELTRAL